MREARDLRARPDAESCAHGHLGAALDPVHVVEHFVGHLRRLARGPGHGHRINEALRRAAEHLQPRRRRHRRDHLHEREALALERALEIAALLEGQVRHDEPATPASRAARGSRSRPNASNGFR